MRSSGRSARRARWLRCLAPGRRAGQWSRDGDARSRWTPRIDGLAHQFRIAYRFYGLSQRHSTQPGGRASMTAPTLRITHIGGPTALIEVGDWRLLTDPTFDPPGRRYTFGLGTA